MTTTGVQITVETFNFVGVTFRCFSFKSNVVGINFRGLLISDIEFYAEKKIRCSFNFVEFSYPK